MTTPAELLDLLWRDYVASTPQAQRIRDLLAARGEHIVDDHVALRTYGVPGLDVAALARPFEAAGWQPRDAYRFRDKHLRARYWQHPDAAVPKVFISELIVEELSPGAQDAIRGLVAQVPGDLAARADLPWAGRPWRVSHATYRALLEESEYAAWMAAFGFRVNHFTVLVNALTTFPDLASVCAFLVERGETLNDSGGVIKGTPADLLEQASTRADSVEVAFDDTAARIPSCYYELARRYPQPSGALFQGFVPASADKIFESTDVVRADQTTRGRVV
ncbi:MAG: DUF1338 domain-containing protein [Deltaproteobacteria bacterium]|nr:DUF1338 domain-containing protein [Deltaproteobacteria bacterium]MCW5803757.1 DUF1338 domain-containing protein [Deltaproteobacteria bacterium]